MLPSRSTLSSMDFCFKNKLNEDKVLLMQIALQGTLVLLQCMQYSWENNILHEANILTVTKQKRNFI